MSETRSSTDNLRSLRRQVRDESSNVTGRAHGEDETDLEDPENTEAGDFLPPED